jgi:hypothetical protein
LIHVNHVSTRQPSINKNLAGFRFNKFIGNLCGDPSFFKAWVV